LCISQAPAGPRLVGTKWNLQLKKADILQTPRTVAIIDLQIQDPAINAHVFPETKHLKFELEKSNTKTY
jgi:hypothetical protein